jgi:hypothetical protein
MRFRQEDMHEEPEDDSALFESILNWMKRLVKDLF